MSLPHFPGGAGESAASDPGHLSQLSPRPWSLSPTLCSPKGKQSNMKLCQTFLDHSETSGVGPVSVRKSMCAEDRISLGCDSPLLSPAQQPHGSQERPWQPPKLNLHRQTNR